MMPLQMLFACLLGWLEAQQRDVIAFSRAEKPRAEGATGPPAASVGR